MKIRIAISALLLSVSSISQGQAVPTATTSMVPSNSGLNFNPLDGVFHYALSGSEIVQLGYYGPSQTTYSTVFSGNAAYTAKSEVRPFNILFGGGVSLANQSGQGTTSFWDVAVSQGYVTRSWIFNISDSFNFLPQSPTTGLSGIPGVGDLGAVPIPGPATGPAGGVLSNSGNRIGNSLSGSVERQLDHATSISGNGSWTILRFLDQSANAGNTGGLDSTQISGNLGLNRRLDGRSSVSLNAVYSTYSYNGASSFFPGTTISYAQPDVETRGINVSYQRTLSRSLSVSVSAGPQWVSSSNSALIPSNVNVFATAGATYSRGLTNASVSYSHGVNAGSGVLPGAISDSVTGSLGHPYGRDWVASISAAYTHTAGLTQVAALVPGAPPNLVYDTVFGGGQVTRRISAHFSGYISYQAQNQSNNYSLTGQSPVRNALNGTSQTFGVGITFSPRSTRLGQF
jgi:hypothetical protein